MQNELKRLRNENDLLRSELDKARKDIEGKNNLINVLNNELRDKHLAPQGSSIKSYPTSTPYEVSQNTVVTNFIITEYVKRDQATTCWLKFTWKNLIKNDGSFI